MQTVHFEAKASLHGCVKPSYSLRHPVSVAKERASRLQIVFYLVVSVTTTVVGVLSTMTRMFWIRGV